MATHGCHATDSRRFSQDERILALSGAFKLNAYCRAKPAGSAAKRMAHVSAAAAMLMARGSASAAMPMTRVSASAATSRGGIDLHPSIGLAGREVRGNKLSGAH